MKLFVVALLITLTTTTASAQVTPVADHHQHLFSNDIYKLLGSPEGFPSELAAADLIPLLDKAGIRRATILSVAYMYGRPSRVIENEYAKVMANNDWTAAQVALYPNRLRGFCGFNPLKDYALQELERCAKNPHLKYGVKLHFGNSDVQLENPEHVEKLKQVFRAANSHRMALAIHMRASISLKRPYGPEQARIFLEQLMPLVPDVPVQIAHMAGTGPGYDDPPAKSVMTVLAQAVAKRDPRTRQLWFDVATCADPDISQKNAALLVSHIRQVGVKRILFGSDGAVAGNSPQAAWVAFRKLPLTEAEFKQIAKNLAPYLK